VQAAHAVAELCLHGPLAGWRNGTLVLYRVDRQDLDRYADRLQGQARSFWEPDLNDERTALATTQRLPEFDELRLL
jgi:hypothetical protein